MSNRDRGGRNPSDDDDLSYGNDIDDVKKSLKSIHSKLFASPALNGAFEQLLGKMDSFKLQQDQVVDRVDDIHDAIYDPDQGLFARVKKTEVINTGEIKMLAERLVNFQEKKTNDDEIGEKLHDAVSVIQKDIIELKQTNAIIKWVAITSGAGMISIVLKFMYDFLTSHVKLI